MRPPTAEEIELAKTLSGDPIALNDRATHGARPPAPHKRPRGRPRKDGQPPHQTEAGRQAERKAAAAALYAATNLKLPNRTEIAPKVSETIPDTIEARLRHFCEKCQNDRARTFLQTFAAHGYRAAVVKTDMGPVELCGLKNGEEFRRLFDYIQAARDAATVAKTCGTLADLANGEYKPKPDCLPPDMRAASLLLPAIDQRFRATNQGTAQAVQINISI